MRSLSRVIIIFYFRVYNMHSPQCYESSFSYIIMHHSATSEEVAETWEEDDTGKRLDQVIRRRKKLKEMSEKMEATAHLPQKDGNGLPGKQSDEKRQIQILKRPTGAARVTNEKPTTSQLKQLAHPTVEERMVSYMEARNRIFGKSPTSLQERYCSGRNWNPVCTKYETQILKKWVNVQGDATHDVDLGAQFLEMTQ
ncbi:hypothetical protein T12_10861 [Trichinella patagoniensis]|uniref:SUZ domain-containing protein n=1 Tax=Trichinella patagoniensis TaxID=990121 RepID=A0A0V1AD21_9BILA|nr:hypothetical protein T12_10861 [Trichinella patagoniensis]